MVPSMYCRPAGRHTLRCPPLYSQFAAAVTAERTDAGGQCSEAARRAPHQQAAAEGRVGKYSDAQLPQGRQDVALRGGTQGNAQELLGGQGRLLGPCCATRHSIRGTAPWLRHRAAAVRACRRCRRITTPVLMCVTACPAGTVQAAQTPYNL